VRFTVMLVSIQVGRISLNHDRVHCVIVADSPVQLLPYLPFFFSASRFLNGYPLVRLSAPVFLLILPSLLANKMHHIATEAKKPLPSVPRLNDSTPVCVHIA